MMTARIRSVKPELFNHEGLFEAELFYKLPLRLAYIALFTCCDREGRFRWQPRRLKLDMLPYDDIDIARMLEVFIERGFIKKYEYQGEIYGCIPSWSRHQRPNHREAESELPSIEESMKSEKIETNINQEISNKKELVVDACLAREPRVPDASRACPGGREGEERRSEGEEKRSIVASRTRPSVEFQQINCVFEHWKTVMNHPNAHLDHKRKAIISKALSFGYRADQLCEAITGCSYTSHNMGDNDRGQRYDGLHVILRDGDQIDRFIHNCHYPPHPVTETDRRSQANIHTLQGWMKRTLVEEEVNANL
jgi:hypothetical protein